MHTQHLRGPVSHGANPGNGNSGCVGGENALRRTYRIQLAIHLGFDFKFFRHVFNNKVGIAQNIKVSADYDVLRDADFVVENVTEKFEVKTQVYRQLDAICPPQCVFAANTSAIPITRIGAMTNRPTQVLGMHFMNPVPLKTAVEVIRGYHTSDTTIAVATRLLGLMGKKAILVNDSPGFVSNRVLMLTINEAIFLVQEKVASPEVVDDIFKNCFEHKMGPLETADLIGLDTILFSIEVLYDEFKDSKFRPCPLLRQMVDAGLHGRKTGRGFYSYED